MPRPVEVNLEFTRPLDALHLDVVVRRHAFVHSNCRRGVLEKCRKAAKGSAQVSAYVKSEVDDECVNLLYLREVINRRREALGTRVPPAPHVNVTDPRVVNDAPAHEVAPVVV